MRFLLSFLNPTSLLLLLVASLVFPLAPPISAAPDYWVYFGTYTGGKSQGIEAARLDAAGRLSEPSLAATTTNPCFLAVDPTHRFLYAVNEVKNHAGQRQGNVTAYSINGQTGTLTKLNEQSSGGDVLCHIQVDATGKTVLVASYGGGSVSALPVDPDGSLGQVASFIKHHGSSVNPANQKGPHAHCIVTDPGNRFALTCDLGLDKVLVYKLDASDATLTANTPACATLTPGFGPRHLAFHPNGKFVYVISEMGCCITVFDYAADRGELSEIQTISTLPAGQKNDPSFSGAEVVVHPSGKFLYSSTRGLDRINLFSIDEKTGRLAHVEDVSSGGKTPRSFNLDPTGRFLIAANQNLNNVVVFQVNSETGHLTPTGQTVEVGSPSCVVFVPAQSPAIQIY